MLGCSGGDGGDAPPSVTPPSDDLVGTYNLTGFDIAYSNGTTITQQSPIITSWSGTMTIGDPTWTQRIVINGVLGTGAGTATVTWTDNTSGVAHITDSTGTHDVAFTISGLNFTTYSGVLATSTPGLTVQEWDHWVKVSDALVPLRIDVVTSQDRQSASPGKHWIWEILNQ